MNVEDKIEKLTKSQLIELTRKTNEFFCLKTSNKTRAELQNMLIKLHNEVEFQGASIFNKVKIPDRMKVSERDKELAKKRQIRKDKKISPKQRKIDELTKTIQEDQKKVKSLNEEIKKGGDKLNIRVKLRVAKNFQDKIGKNLQELRKLMGK